MCRLLITRTSPSFLQKSELADGGTLYPFGCKEPLPIRLNMAFIPSAGSVAKNPSVI